MKLNAAQTNAAAAIACFQVADEMNDFKVFNLESPMLIERKFFKIFVTVLAQLRLVLVEHFGWEVPRFSPKKSMG